MMAQLLSTCEIFLLCLENATSLDSSTTSGSYNSSTVSTAMISEPSKRGCNINILFRVENSVGFFFFILYTMTSSVVHICVNHSLVPMEASLLRFKKYSNLWV